MKFIDEYRDSKLFLMVIEQIKKSLSNYTKELSFMEVCGTHTMAIFRSGIRSLIPKQIRLISGPGCPVCVTSNGYIDKAILYAKMKDIIIVSFGDMLRVPGSASSLEKEKANGSDVRIVYSSLDALEIAKKNPKKKIIFLGVGFETTAPTVAATIRVAKQQDISNFFVFSAHKTMPQPMRALVQAKDLRIDGFICPGHVSTIIGSRPYEFIAKDFHIPCVIAGFEPLDIAQGIYMLVEAVVNNKPGVYIQYKRLVKVEGNPAAVKIMNEVFQEDDAVWRGLGLIPKSGLKIRKDYSRFDAERNFKVKVKASLENKNCICGDVLKGIKVPTQCKLFKKVCKPENPVGACMVSSEGTCAAYYKYEKNGM